MTERDEELAALIVRLNRHGANGFAIGKEAAARLRELSAENARLSYELTEARADRDVAIAMQEDAAPSPAVEPQYGDDGCQPAWDKMLGRDSAAPSAGAEDAEDNMIVTIGGDRWDRTEYLEMGGTDREWHSLCLVTRRAEKAEQRVAELSEPGTAGALAAWAHEYAQSLGKSPVSSDGPSGYIVGYVKGLDAALVASLEQEQDAAATFRAMSEECAIAGLPAGDRTVVLRNLRELIKRERALRKLLTRIANWDMMGQAADGPYWLREISAAIDAARGEVPK